MAVAYDASATCSTTVNLTGSPVGESFAHTAASGADVFLALNVASSSAPTSIAYNGTTLALVSSESNNNSNANGTVYLYRGAGLGTGGSANFTFTVPASTYFCASSVSYTGVGYIGVATAAYGSSSFPSSGSITSNTNGLVLGIIGSYNANEHHLNSVSGGTNRSLLSSSTTYVSLAFSDSLTTATFAGVENATAYWATIGVALVPSTIPVSLAGGGALTATVAPYLSNVAYDATGAGAAWTGVNSYSYAHTAVAQADIFLAINVADSATAPSSVQYNGQNLPLLTSLALDNTSADGVLYVYRGVKVGTGSSANITFTVPTAWFCANSVSYTGVGTVSSAITNYGVSTSPSGGSISCGSNEIIVGIIGSFQSTSYHMSAVSGGTNRSLQNTSTTYSSLAISDSASTATFAATVTGEAYWGSIELTLAPMIQAPVTGHGALTVTVKPKIPATLHGHGALTATAVNPDAQPILLPGHGSLAATAYSKKFILTAAPSGHGVLIGTVKWQASLTGVGKLSATALNSAVTFDAVGAGGSVSDTTLTISHTAAAGAAIIVWVLSFDSISAPAITATCDATPMAFTGKSYMVLNASGYYHLTGFYVLNVTAGSHSVVITDNAAGFMKAGSVSYLNVAYLGRPLTCNGSSTSISSPTMASTGGHMVANALVGIYGATFSAYNNTLRKDLTSTAGWPTVPMYIGDTAGATSVTFTATDSSTYGYGAAVVDLFPIPNVWGLPTGNGALAATAVNRLSQKLQLAGRGVLHATTKQICSVGAALRGRSVSQNMGRRLLGLGSLNATAVAVNNPLGIVLTKLANGQSTTIQVIGDSTAWGAYDTGFTESDPIWGPPTLCGWPGRLAMILGKYYNATVQVYTWNYPTDTAYANLTTLYTGSGGSPPVITVYNGGWPGAVMANYVLNGEPAMLPVANPDVLIINDGWNEPSYVSGNQFADYYSQFINDAQTTYCPGAPIIATTQNQGISSAESTRTAAWAALISFLLPGKSLPLSPVVQFSTAGLGGVWVIDTKQAGQTAPELYSGDGLHPIAAGYQMQAAYMAAQLAPGVTNTMFPTTVVNANLTGSGTLAAATKPIIKTSSALSGHGAPAASDKPQYAAALAGHGALTAPIKVALTATLTGHGTLIKAGIPIAPAPHGSGALAGGVVGKISVTAPLTGQGHISVSEYARYTLALPFTGSGQLTSNAYSISVYDTAGTGYTGSEIYEAAWTHRAAPGSYVIAQIFSQPAPETVYYGTTAMTNLGTATVSSGFGYLTFYGVGNVVGGTNTITADWGDYTARDVIANSTSYTNVEDATNPQGISNQYGYKSPQAVVASQGLIVQAFAGVLTSSGTYLTDYTGGTVRWANQINQYTTGATSAMCIVGESANDTTLTALLSTINTDPYDRQDYVWAAYAVTLTASVPMELRGRAPITAAENAPMSGAGTLSVTVSMRILLRAPELPVHQSAPTARKVVVATTAPRRRANYSTQPRRSYAIPR